MYSYQAFSLAIHSQLFFPELLISNSQQPDVTIRCGIISEEDLGDLSSTGLYYEAKPTSFGLYVPSIGRFLVRGGDDILIEPVEGIDEDSIRAMVLGPCLVALLMQRELFLLHGSVVKIEDKCISFAGDHGVGKSTLTEAFARNDHAILSDDICAINSQGKVLASFPQIQLWQDVAAVLNIDTKTYRRLRPGIEKFSLPVTNFYYSNPLPLQTIYILNPYNKNDLDLKRLTGSDKIKYLHRLIYNKPFVSGFKKDHIYFNYCAMLASQVDMIMVNRPMLGFQLANLVECIENTLDVHYATE